MRVVHLFRVNGDDSSMFDFHSLFFLIVCFIFLFDVEIASVSLISVLTRGCSFYDLGWYLCLGQFVVFSCCCGH